MAPDNIGGSRPRAMLEMMLWLATASILIVGGRIFVESNTICADSGRNLHRMRVRARPLFPTVRGERWLCLSSAL
jgi:hypothetical protein